VTGRVVHTFSQELGFPDAATGGQGDIMNVGFGKGRKTGCSEGSIEAFDGVEKGEGFIFGGRGGVIEIGGGAGGCSV